MGSLQSPPMEPASPARLYAAGAGALLFVAGVAGFFADRSWLNYAHVATGAVALLLASTAPRAASLCLGLLYTGLAGWGFSTGEAWMQWPHLALGVLGLAAYAGSEARAQLAAERP